LAFIFATDAIAHKVDTAWYVSNVCNLVCDYTITPPGVRGVQFGAYQNIS
jgi:hypothetical protein